MAKPGRGYIFSKFDETVQPHMTNLQWLGIPAGPALPQQFSFYAAGRTLTSAITAR
jgi:hypothetical protein